MMIVTDGAGCDDDGSVIIVVFSKPPSLSHQMLEQQGETHR